MLLRLVSLLPPNFVRFLARMQFHFPVLRRIIVFAGNRISDNEGVIQRGIGAGLRFNATGGNPGYLLGTSMPEEQETLKSLLKEGSVFYDLGANIGFYSTLAAHLVGPKGQVYAFEPFPSSAAAARLNAELNGFTQVSVIEAAVSDKAGTAAFTLGEASRNHKLSSGTSLDPAPETGASFHVPCLRLDSYIEEMHLRLPDVVMIDIEGAEVNALNGLADTIRRCKPAIMCEVHWIPTEFDHFCLTVLAPLGYTVTTFAGDPIPAGIVRYHALMTANREEVKLSRAAVFGAGS